MNQEKTMIPSEVEREIESRFHANLQWWNYVRWLSTISFLAIGILQMAMEEIPFPKFSFVLILMSIVFLNFCYSFWIQNFAQKKFYPMIHNLLDIAIFSLAIYMTGGINSPLIWLYTIPILTSSITIDQRIGFFATTFSVVGLFFIMFFAEYGPGVHLEPNFWQNVGVFLQDNLQTVLSFTCLFFLVYFVSSSLAKTLREQGKDFQVLSHKLEKKNREFAESVQTQIKKEKQTIIDKLARTFRHEMNNPLAILSFNIEMLVKDKGRSMAKRSDTLMETLMRLKVIMAHIENMYKEKDDFEQEDYEYEVTLPENGDNGSLKQKKLNV